MKKLITLLLLITSISIFAQTRKCLTFGEPSKEFTTQQNLDIPDVMNLPVAIHYLNVTADTTCLVDHSRYVLSQLNSDLDNTGHLSDLDISPFFPGLEFTDVRVQVFLADKGHPQNWNLKEGEPAVTINSNSIVKFGANGFLSEIIGGKGYINIVVADIQNGILGYSVIGGRGTGTNGDGVVIAKFAFGAKDENGNNHFCGIQRQGVGQNFNFSRAATNFHEFGHYLSLGHIFSDYGTCENDNDYCSDTPQTKEPLFQNELGAYKVSCDASYNMPWNALSYSSDNTIRSGFTAQQRDRVETHTYLFLKDLWQNYEDKLTIEVDTTVDTPIVIIEVPIDTLEGSEGVVSDTIPSVPQIWTAILLLLALLGIGIFTATRD